jgi:hypothetical protein
MYPYVGQWAQVLGEILHVDAGAAVYVRRVFAGQQINAKGHVRQTSRFDPGIRLALTVFDR